jgi:hypothetical protein
VRAIRPRTRARDREQIVTIDTDSAPRILFYGENFLLEDLPVGTRVIYPRRPMTGGGEPHRRDPLRAQPPGGHAAAARRCSSRAWW